MSFRASCEWPTCQIVQTQVTHINSKCSMVIPIVSRNLELISAHPVQLHVVIRMMHSHWKLVNLDIHLAYFIRLMCAIRLIIFHYCFFLIILLILFVLRFRFSEKLKIILFWNVRIVNRLLVSFSTSEELYNFIYTVGHKLETCISNFNAGLRFDLLI